MTDTKIKSRARGVKNTKKPEILYKELIKSGDVEVIRRRGQPPLIRWITRV